MLYYVSGPVTVLEPGLAVIDCGGVGYGYRSFQFVSNVMREVLFHFFYTFLP